MGNGVESIIKYSICVPVYNVERYLIECLDSICEQTFSSFELLLVDDGSTDQSGALCDAYAQRDTRIKVIHQTNAGLMMTRKRAVEEARGEYLLFVDSDDYVDRNLLMTLEHCIDTSPVKDLDIILYAMKNEYATGKKTPKEVSTKRDADITYLSGEELMRRFLEGRDPYAIFTKAVRRTLLQQHLEDIYLPVNYAEDVLQSAHIFSYAKHGAVIDQVLYHYRIRRSSLIHSKNYEALQQIVQVQLEAGKIVERAVDFSQLSSSEESLACYYGRCLNNLLEGVYRLNVSSDPHKLKYDAALWNLQDVQYLIQHAQMSKLSFYNAVRYSFWKKGHYRMLLWVDYILHFIQVLIQRCKGQIAFE